MRSLLGVFGGIFLGVAIAAGAVGAQTGETIDAGDQLYVRVIHMPDVTRNYIVGEDGIVDLSDHLRLVECLGGPSAPVSNDCRIVDVDRSGAVDMRDVAIVQRVFTGP